LFKSIELIFNLAKKASDDGKYFQLWGIGMGFEALVELIYDSNK